MRIYKLLLIVLIALGINACNQKPKNTADSNVKYYRNILFSETSWDTERGSRELTAEEAKSINNYKFTYNENKQLLSIEYNRNNVLLNYSSMGAAKSP